MKLSEFMDRSNRADSPESVVNLMERAAQKLGFDRFAYYALTRRERYECGDNPPPAVAHNFPKSWIDYYFENDYASKDPVVVHAPEIEGPFLWDWLDTTFKLDPAQKTLMQEADAAGLKNGVGVPLHGPQGDVCLVTFAASNGHADPEARLPKLNALASQFHVAYRTVGRSDIEPLSVAVLSCRERECLQWIAQGKTSWDISMLLSISENTVNFHVKSACKKLDSSSRMLAVVKSIRFGLINLV